MKTKEDIREILLSDYDTLTSESGSVSLHVRNSFIPIDLVIDWAYRLKGEKDEYLYTAINEAIEYFSS